MFRRSARRVGSEQPPDDVGHDGCAGADDHHLCAASHGATRSHERLRGAHAEEREEGEYSRRNESPPTTRREEGDDWCQCANPETATG